MRLLILTLILFGSLFLTTNSVSAKGVIIYGNGEKIDVVHYLPEDITVNNGEHVNLGVMYKQFSLFWIPVWNYGETQYVLINDNEDTYYDIDAEEIDILKSGYDIPISEKPTIDFWNRIGGKLIWGAVILLVIYFGWQGRNDDKEAEIPAQDSNEPTNKNDLD